ncbi:hypothetical protein C2W62_18105 [Candidatus Entotheonella serta]|nr:hypothetical protein C2W62_18105 [Candidatus Entotheonella serta]
MANHDGHLLVLYDGGDNTIQLRRSADNGVTWGPQAALQSGIASGSLKATLDLIRYTFDGDEEIQFIYGLANGDIYRKRIDTPAHKADYDDALHWISELVYACGKEPRSHAVLLHAENISAEVAIVYQTQAHYIQMLFWSGSSWEAARQLSANKRRRHAATWDTQNHQIHAFVEGNIASGHSDILRSVFTIATLSLEPSSTSLLQILKRSALKSILSPSELLIILYLCECTFGMAQRCSPPLCCPLHRCGHDPRPFAYQFIRNLGTNPCNSASLAAII